MPILNVKLSAQPSPALSHSVANTLIALTAEILHKDPAVTSVALDYIDPHNWIVGGRSLVEHGKSSFYLEIAVVDGTTTKDDKARYIDAVFTSMREHLGDLHPESYIYVNDVPADSYGFTGVTQEFRYIQSRL
ncbi:MAG: 4-oxalocrotonate tautomerase family protein [Herpetosiphon sp.]